MDSTLYNPVSNPFLSKIVQFHNFYSDAHVRDDDYRAIPYEVLNGQIFSNDFLDNGIIFALYWFQHLNLNLNCETLYLYF